MGKVLKRGRETRMVFGGRALGQILNGKLCHQFCITIRMSTGNTVQKDRRDGREHHMAMKDLIKKVTLMGSKEGMDCMGH